MWVKVLDPKGNGIRVPALADSGSRRYSFISEACLKMLPADAIFDIKLLEQPRRIATASGEVVSICEAAGLCMRVPSGKILRGYWLILKNCPVPIILGHDKLETMDEMAKQVRYADKEDRRLANKHRETDGTAYVVHETDTFFSENTDENEEDLALIPGIPQREEEEERLKIPNIEEGSEIDQICQRFRKVFRKSLSDTAADVKPMEIKLQKDAIFPSTMQERLRPVPLAYRDEVERQLQEMEQVGVIEEVRDAEYYSQLLVVRKKDGALRLCVDFRGLNSITVRNRHPIPLIKDLVSRLRGQKVMGVLDLSQGYWQAPLEEQSRQLTTFATPNGMFRFKRVAFGLCNAPTYFQSAIQREVLGDLHGKACLIYIDDILILGRSRAEFLQNLTAVLQRLEAKGIAIKPSKCRLGVEAVEYVGLLISGEKVEMTQSRKQAIANITLPKSISKLRAFLGLLNYFRDHIRNFARLTAPLNELLQGKPMKKALIPWTPEAEECFEKCRAAASNAETLFHLQPEGEISLHTDASEKAIGGVITQRRQGREYPILFLSKKLSRAQQNYSTSDKEMLAIFHSIRAAHQLLAGRRFDVYTDHRALQTTKVSASARVERMKLALAEYNFTIHYIRGESNAIADLMSRPEGEMEKTAKEEAEAEAEEAAVVAVAAPENKQQIMAAHHNAYTGHFGRDSTVESIRASGFDWPGIHKDVARMIAGCDICQRGRPMSAMKQQPFQLSAHGPNQEWSADVMELEPVRGYVYILVVICNYSRYIHLTKMRSVSAAETVEALETLFLEFGRPERVRTDNGTNFKNENVVELLNTYGVTAVAIAPYESRSNGIVERAIREVRRHLYAFTKQGHPWPDRVKHVQFLMNRTVHKATGFAPADILFGQINSLGFGAVTPLMREVLGQTPASEMDEEGGGVREERDVTNNTDEREEALMIDRNLNPVTRDIAARQRRQADLQAEAQENYQAQRVRPPERDRRAGPEVGDRVWIRVRVMNKNAGREHWAGPAEIRSISGDPTNGTEVFTVRMSDGSEQKVTRAKMRRIPRGVTLEGRTEGAEILECNSWQVGKPIEHYQLRIRHPDGTASWEEASAWLRRPEFQLYALTAPHLSHLAFVVKDA